MNKTIDLKSVYRNEDLYSKRSFNKENAAELLKILKKEFESKDIHFLLNFGTLLGAVREHDFIGHDVDIDLSMREKDLNSFLQLIPKLEAYGIQLCGHFKNKFFSLFYNGVICDFDIVFNTIFPYSLRYEEVLEKKYPKYYTDKTQFISFLGELFEVPKNPERFLEYMYGESWRIPQKGKQARLFPHWMLLSRFHYYLKQFVRHHF